MDAKHDNVIAQLGTILGVWAHPDDETWASAGIMMAAIANGQRVVCVTATKGELGSVDEVRWPLEALGEVRKRELAAALNLIGVNEFYELNYCDGDCENIEVTKACTNLLQIYNKVCPDTVLTFGSDGWTGHKDHKAVGLWAKIAADSCLSKPVVYAVTESQERYQTIGKKCDEQLSIYFNTDTPFMLPEAAMDLCFRLSKELLDRKIEALHAHTSQTEKLMQCLQDGTVTPYIATPECFTKYNL